MSRKQASKVSSSSRSAKSQRVADGTDPQKVATDIRPLAQRIQSGRDLRKRVPRHAEWDYEQFWIACRSGRLQARTDQDFAHDFSMVTT